MPVRRYGMVHDEGSLEIRSPCDDLDITVDSVAPIAFYERRHPALESNPGCSTQAAYRAGVAELGPVDIVLANAGICQLGSAEPDPARAFREVVDINLVGVWNTVQVAAHDLIDQGRGAVVLTSSTQGLTGRGADGSGGQPGYTAAKHGVVGLMRGFANWLSPHGIRVNSVHPTGVATPMIVNDVIGTYLQNDPTVATAAANLMPVDMLEPRDVSNAISFLVSDEARYVTGVTFSSTRDSRRADRIENGRLRPPAGMPLSTDGGSAGVRSQS